ncbi:WD40-repeat-containing domain protein [Jimgerdemannia flammicorona]|uniref:Eukaryotic translation initiation factor 3 subunit I n=1 Tax=Jimgerdemannia flammicorona TaxID=994334 RepID=A0A433QMF7_9FUNG|nr:WD40-repeat-containing domain protein [Jimgerdemannia flammicorona]
MTSPENFLWQPCPAVNCIFETQLHRNNGHTRSLTQIKYNREGDLLFTVSKDKVVNVWFSHNGERLGTYIGHQGSVWTCDVNPTSTLLITGSADNSVKLWEVRTGRCLKTWEFKTAVKRVEFTEEGDMALCVSEQRMGFPGAVTILEINPDIDAEQSDEPFVVIYPEGSKATVAGWSYLNKYIIMGHEDGSISQWDWKSQERLKFHQPHVDVITDIQFSEDRSYFVTASKDKTAQVFEASTLDPLKKFSTDTPLNSASFTPRYQEFVVVGGGQEAMNVTTTGARAGKFECRFWHKILEEELGRVKGHFGPINTIAVHPDGRRTVLTMVIIWGRSFSSGGEDGYVRVHTFDDDYYKFKIDA